MIHAREISQAAIRDGVPEKTVEKDYVIHWIMAGLGKRPFGRNLAFKGGTALRLCWFKGYRYSEDIDLTVTRPVTFDELAGVFNEISAWVRQESAVEVQISPNPPEPHSDGFSFHAGYRGPLGSTLGRRELKVDVSTSEMMKFPIETRTLIKNFSDIPARSRIACYALDEIVCEKFRSLLNPARREPRDIYDLWYLSENTELDIQALKPAFRDKSAFKGLKPDKLLNTLSAKKKALAILYEKRLANQIAELPPFEKAFKAVARTARML